jgi:hypothetical protein
MTFLFKMAGFSLKNPSKCNSALSCCTSLDHLSSAVVFGLCRDGSDDDEETERRKSKIVETESCAPLRHSFFRSRQLQQVTTCL